MMRFFLFILELRKKRWERKLFNLRLKQNATWEHYEQQIKKWDKRIKKLSSVYDNILLTYNQFGIIDRPDPDEVSMEDAIRMVAPPDPPKKTFLQKLFKR